MGLVTPLACGVEETWTRLLAGQSGAKPITTFDVSDLPARIAATIPRGDGADGTFNPGDWIDHKDLKRVDDFILFSMAAAEQAIRDSGFPLETEDQQCRAGVMIGSGIGGLAGIEEATLMMKDKGPRRLSPFFIPGRLINLTSGYVSIRWGLKGPNHSAVTACATGTHAIGDAARMIMWDDADVMVAGGAESAICRIGVAGFAACRALSTNFNDHPEQASRPWDKDRDGFLMGEGAGVVVLEAMDHAIARGAKIYGEVVGYGLSGDAYHITSPPPDGNGAYRAMEAALKRAKMTPDQIDYINAHGTSTPVGDEIELAAVERLFGNAAARVAMSSTKSSIGHLLGAAGAVEAIFCLLAMRDGVVPPTLNLHNPSVDTPVNLVPLTAQKREIDVAMSNSFGFGGTNATLILSRVA
jgi:3-oxoacyl-[acyl-carrier-protein] synthase II